MLILAKKQKPSKGAKDSTYQFKDSYKVGRVNSVNLSDFLSSLRLLSEECACTGGFALCYCLISG